MIHRSNPPAVLLVLILIAAVALLTDRQTAAAQQPDAPPFVQVRGTTLVSPDGTPLLLRGINLGNWLVPEGYMFRLDSATSFRMINGLLSELIGPAETHAFWKTFRDCYITRADIRYIKSIGLNSVRVPFSFRLFLSEEFPGIWTDEGFRYLDSVMAWCGSEGLLVILDMHCAPGGQTGDNIDDSWGYPWLFEEESEQERTAELWRRIAQRYTRETCLVGYDLLNEPIAPFFDVERLNPRLEPLYKRIAAAIRSVDTNHVVFLGGAQWNSNFKVFGQPFDARAVYTFHRYWCDTTQALVQEFVDFRNRFQVPVWLGESGENTDIWIDAFRRLLERNAIGWCFWPYKRMDASRCIVTVARPAGWDVIRRYDHSRRTTYAGIRSTRPDPAVVRKALEEYLRAITFDACRPNAGYISALGCAIPR